MQIGNKTFFPDSKNIADIEYFPENKNLEVNFKPKGRYVYHEVPADIAEQFQKTQSAGTFFAKMIKNKFRFTQIK